MKTIAQLLELLNQVEDKSQTIGIWCGGRYHDIGEVTSDAEGVYLEPEEVVGDLQKTEFENICASRKWRYILDTQKGDTRLRFYNENMTDTQIAERGFIVYSTIRADIWSSAIIAIKNHDNSQ